MVPHFRGRCGPVLGRGLPLNTLHCFEKKNECPHDDKPSTGMFAVSDDVFSALSSSRGSVVS